MSWAAMQGRLMLLIARKFDTEHQIELLNDHKFKLSSMTTNLMNLKADYEPNSPHDKALQAKIHMLYEAEKALEMRVAKLTRQLDAFNKEEEQLNNRISKNIDTFFKYGYGRT